MPLRQRPRPQLWIVLLVLLSLIPTATVAAQGETKKTDSTLAAKPAANPSDVVSVDAIIGALYDVISGPAGHKRNWDRMRSLFAPGARLIVARAMPNGGAQPFMMDVEGYIQRAGPGLEREGFFEREVFSKQQAFGNILHRFSTYESRHNKDDAKPFARGINSIQLLKDGNRWWVVTVYWDSEREGNPITAEYLPHK
ncbi:MAG: hypothetical protein ABR543_18930 [Gemmatimonadaceae bacterium]